MGSSWKNGGEGHGFDVKVLCYKPNMLVLLSALEALWLVA
jgi:hypothetical protein